MHSCVWGRGGAEAQVDQSGALADGFQVFQLTGVEFTLDYCLLGEGEAPVEVPLHRIVPY